MRQDTKNHSSIYNKLFLTLLTLFISMTFFLSVEVLAKDMTLLAVSTGGNSSFGSGADLSLVITRGSGRVFMETVPFTKLDTQMSTHFAKEVACNYLDMDCSKYDFFYTIKSNSAIVGGPSAGAAIAFLTISKLKNENYNNDFSITGTINTGGIIGRVGGVKEKITAASVLGLKKVFIPKGDRYLTERDDLLLNITESGDISDVTENIFESKNKTDLVEFGKSLGVDVVEVSTIDELACGILRMKCENLTGKVEVNTKYQETMLNIGVNICNRSNALIEKIGNPNLEYALKNNVINLTISDIDISSLVDLMLKRKYSFMSERYYSMASFCFSSNLILQNYLKENISLLQFESEIEKLKKSIHFFEEQMTKKNLRSITDLQTYIIVKERLDETSEYINSLSEIDKIYSESASKLNETEIKNLISNKKAILAFATERFHSAGVWSDFFDKDESEFDINQDVLKNGCLNKIYEAQERVEYLRLYFPSLVESSQKSIDYALKEFDTGDYAFCLFKASKAKAQIDAMLSSISVSDEIMDDILVDKKKITARLIKKQQDKGIFPILGFSYFEYAESLSQSDKISDKVSALLYYDYAIEFSNLDIYFKKKDSNLFDFSWINFNYLSQIFIYSIVFFIGFFSGNFSGFVSEYGSRLIKIIRSNRRHEKLNNNKKLVNKKLNDKKSEIKKSNIKKSSVKKTKLKR